MPEKTEEEFFDDETGRRWFKTGDIGQVVLEDPKLNQTLGGRILLLFWVTLARRLVFVII